MSENATVLKIESINGFSSSKGTPIKMKKTKMRMPTSIFMVLRCYNFIRFKPRFFQNYKLYTTPLSTLPILVIATFPIDFSNSTGICLDPFSAHSDCIKKVT